MAVSEETLRAWTAPSSNSEDDRRNRTERMIREAIQASPDLRRLPVRVYAKGSYKNNTNVRLDSDVDVAVEYTGIFYFHQFFAAEGLTREQLGIFPGHEFSFSAFKAAIHQALNARFGAASVERGDKALFVHEGRTSLDADVVPCVSFRIYTAPGSYREGIQLWPDSGGTIENYPRLNYEKGVAKNHRTGNHYKWIVRALKRLENELVSRGSLAIEIPSYLMECLVYMAPNSAFNVGSLRGDMRDVLAHIYNGTMSDEACNEWTEVNEVKYLFRPAQKWTRGQAHALAVAAWNYMGFE
jgi:hypothetical protein